MVGKVVLAQDVGAFVMVGVNQDIVTIDVVTVTDTGYLSDGEAGKLLGAFPFPATAGEGEGGQDEDDELVHGWGVVWFCVKVL